MDINSIIRKYLADNNISQIELAAKLGISNTSLNRSLNSDDLKISLFIKICQALKVPASKFFDGSEIYSNEEIESLKQDIELLKKQVKHYTELYEDGKGEAKNLMKIVKSTYSIDPKISDEAKHTLKIITKFFDEDPPDGMKKL